MQTKATSRVMVVEDSPDYQEVLMLTLSRLFRAGPCHSSYRRHQLMV